MDNLAHERNKNEWLINAVCAFFSNANVKPIEPSKMTPYADEYKQQVETVSFEEFKRDMEDMGIGRG